MTAVRRIDPTADLFVPEVVAPRDYADAFEIATHDRRPAERWARDALEGAPRPLRWFVMFGWRFVLGLRLAPGTSPDHVLGWKVVKSEQDVAVLEARSRLLVANLLFEPKDGRFVWVSALRFESGLARPIWAVVGLLHRRIVPYVVGRAARQG